MKKPLNKRMISLVLAIIMIVTITPMIATATVMPGLSLSQSNVIIDLEEKITLTANISVTWSSSNPEIASVTNGVVTGKTFGTTEITATAIDGSGSSSCTVTVQYSGLINTEGTDNTHDYSGLLIVQQGEWIFFNYDGLYRMNNDGSNKTRLKYGFCSSINVLGEWIYFLQNKSICRIKIDGTNEEIILTDNNDIDILYIKDDWMYFLYKTNNNDYYRRYSIDRIKVNGTERKTLVSECSYGFRLNDGWIYYQVNFPAEIWRIKIDGTNNEKILPAKDYGNYDTINVVDGYIYTHGLFNYDSRSRKHSILKIKTDGTTETNLFTSDHPIMSVVVSGDTAFYQDGNSIYAIETNGSDRKLLYTIPGSSDGSYYGMNVCVINDLIYFANWSANEIYRMKKDGTDLQLINLTNSYDLASGSDTSDISFLSLSANGSSNAATTQLTINFDSPVPELTEADFTVTGAIKGTLSQSSTSNTMYYLTLTDILVAHLQTITLTVVKENFSFEPNNRTVGVYNPQSSSVNEPTATADKVGFSTISAGFHHTMAIKNDGSLWAWGYNNGDGISSGRENIGGQLGDGTTENKFTPVKIMENMIQVSTGMGYTMAIDNENSLWAWGENRFGRLGDGTTDDKFNPVKIMDDVLQVSAGGSHTVAIKNDGSLWAWGRNDIGFLGDGTTDDRITPVKIMDGVVQVSAGGHEHTMAIKSDGSLWAWGNNTNEQIGDGTSRHKYTPVKIMDDVMQVSAGNTYTMAIKSDNSLWAWGNNYYGQLGDGTTETRYTPVKIMDDVIQISAGKGTSNSFTMAIKSDGSLWACGNNDYGQLGDGTLTTYDDNWNRIINDKFIPVKIMDDVVQVSAGDSHTVALKSDRSLWTWGSNQFGELGDGTTESSLSSLKIMDDVLFSASLPVVPTDELATNSQSQASETVDNRLEYIWTINPIYDDLRGVANSQNTANILIPAKKNDLWGIIDANEHWALTPQFEEISYAVNSSSQQVIFPAKQDGLWGFVNKAGAWIVPAQFEELQGSFYDNDITDVSYVPAKQDGKWGIIDKTGNWIISPQFEEISDWGVDYICTVKYNGKYGCISYGINIPSEYIYDEPEGESINFTSLPPINDINDEESAIAAVEELLRSMSDEQKQSSIALDQSALFIENALKQGSQQKMNGRTITIDATALEPVARRSETLRRDIDALLESEDVELLREYRTDLMFASDEKKHSTFKLDESITAVDFDKVTVSSPFASVSVNKTDMTGDDGNIKPMNITVNEKGGNGFNIFRLWGILVITAVITAWLILRKKVKWFKLWIMMIICIIAVGINAVTFIFITMEVEFRVEVKFNNAEKILISLPVTDKNADTDYLMIFDENNNPMSSKYNPATNTVDAHIDESGTYLIKTNKVDFTDISHKNESAQEAITQLASKGIMRGTSETTFSPEFIITRAEFASAILKAFDLLDMALESTFIDVDKSDWFYPIAASVQKTGLMIGFEDNTFRADSTLPKEQMVVVAANTLMEQMQYKALDEIEEWLSRYIDRIDIADWSENGVALATKLDLVLPRIDLMFAPASTMTRGDAAIMVYMLFDRIW